MKSDIINQLKKFLGKNTITILENFYGIGKGFDIKNIDKAFKNPKKRLDLIRFFIKAHDYYYENNRSFHCHIEVIRCGNEYKELFVNNDKPYNYSDWEGVRKIN